MYNDFEDREDANVPDIFRGLTKNKVFDLVAREYVLPSKDSRSITKQYLYQVHQGEVFRITKEVLLGFEATLQTDDFIKTPFYNVGYLIQRLDILLQQTGRRQLGFPAGVQPDDKWFTRILRYLDQFNILGAFKSRVRNAQPPNSHAGRV
jgi:hypothetical protein